MENCKTCFYDPKSSECFNCLQIQVSVREGALKLLAKDFRCCIAPLGLLRFFKSNEDVVNEYIEKARNN